ncbi:Glyoxalase/Bleomycin resistance protein/Dihydroxybiphenyl dioxygenase [Plectosphaerella plurivora]|uniref:Glyoxalase/Bleomycin resistance protein/Dihydroxybiphenyl dioxygenase n=1 Tax=Plectosphaerella plurivora TaxID=936078 RepID=A0A9P9AB70_9PEZI|nr:Glyoxalase/Bleomycin resistance protein/Dihydroxybiphenyl dioxygenase [Plectosphaerella plurivora]
MANARAVVKALDHLVLTCRDVAATSSWYATHLGMKAETFVAASDPSVTRHALRFGTQKINLHQRGREFEPKATTALPGTADLCFVVEDSTDLKSLAAAFEKDGINVLEGGGVVDRTGAVGPIRSIYVRDPDGNLVELSHY